MAYRKVNKPCARCQVIMENVNPLRNYCDKCRPTGRPPKGTVKWEKVQPVSEPEEIDQKERFRRDVAEAARRGISYGKLQAERYERCGHGI